MKQGSLLCYIAEGWFGGAPSSPPAVAVLRVPLFSASPGKELLRAGACKRERAPGGIQKQHEVDGEGWQWASGSPWDVLAGQTEAGSYPASFSVWFK